MNWSDIHRLRDLQKLLEDKTPEESRIIIAVDRDDQEYRDGLRCVEKHRDWETMV